MELRGVILSRGEEAHFEVPGRDFHQGEAKSALSGQQADTFGESSLVDPMQVPTTSPLDDLLVAGRRKMGLQVIVSGQVEVHCTFLDQGLHQFSETGHQTLTVRVVADGVDPVMPEEQSPPGGRTERVLCSGELGPVPTALEEGRIEAIDRDPLWKSRNRVIDAGQPPAGTAQSMANLLFDRALAVPVVVARYQPEIEASEITVDGLELGLKLFIDGAAAGRTDPRGVDQVTGDQREVTAPSGRTGPEHGPCDLPLIGLPGACVPKDEKEQTVPAVEILGAILEVESREGVGRDHLGSGDEVDRTASREGQRQQERNGSAAASGAPCPGWNPWCVGAHFLGPVRFSAGKPQGRPSHGLKDCRTPDRRLSVRSLTMVLALLGLAGPLGASPIPAACRGLDLLQVWEWSDPAGFPERSDPELAVPEVVAREPWSFGIAFSGGGTRAASATLGQLRALHEQGWLDKAQYISAVSGGSWAAIPYTFLPETRRAELSLTEEKFTDDEFLGPYVEPGAIDHCALTAVPDRSYARAISSTRLPGLFLSRVFFRFDETYSRALGKKILREFDLYEGERLHRPEGPARMVAAHNAQRAHLQERSRVQRPRRGQPWQHLCPAGADGKTLCDDEFLVPRPGRPFLIVGATLLEKKRGKSAVHSVDMTPLYTGMRETFDFPRKGRPITLGGGFIETAAYDSIQKWAATEGTGGTEGRAAFSTCFKRGRFSKYRYRLTLSDMMGASGAAPVVLLRSLGLNTLGFPEFNARSIGPPTEKVFEFAHGDGGHADDLGLAALLARGVQNILAFANSQASFCPAGQDCPANKGLRMASDIQCYFEQEPGSAGETRCEKKRNKKSATVPTLFTQDGFERILKGFEELKRQNKPLIYCDAFAMVAQPDPIVGPLNPYTPRICWVQLDRNEDWLAAVEQGSGRDDKLVRRLAHRGRPFKNFPHYKTFGERFWKLRIIDMNEAQVNALAHLTAWTVKEGAATIEGCLLSPEPVCGLGELPRED